MNLLFADTSFFVAYLNPRDVNHALAREYMTTSSEDRFEIVTANDESFGRGLELFVRRPDKEWSFTDCVSFDVMKDREITDALTADHHFEQAGFTLLLKKK